MKISLRTISSRLSEVLQTRTSTCSGGGAIHVKLKAPTPTAEALNPKTLGRTGTSLAPICKSTKMDLCALPQCCYDSMEQGQRIPAKEARNVLQDREAPKLETLRASRPNGIGFGGTLYHSYNLGAIRD